MTEITFLQLEAAFAAVWLAARIAVWIRRGRIDWKREAVLLLMYINLAVIIRFAFFPMARADGRVRPLVFNAAAAFPFRVNLIPLVRLSDYVNRREMWLNVIGNTAMFIPGGIILPIVYKRLDTFLKVLVAGTAISLCIEILQLPFSVRSSDIDDLLQNMLGVIVGYGIYALARGRKAAGTSGRTGTKNTGENR